MKYRVFASLAPSLALFSSLLASCGSQGETKPFDGFGADGGPALVTTPDGSSGPGLGTPGGGFGECAKSTYQGRLIPSAMLVVLDGSGTMAEGAKYENAQQAIVETLDQDAFDGLSLGLLIYPTGTMSGPECVFGFPVTCRVNSLLQVPLADSGSEKSAGSGVRAKIYSQLANSSPNKTGVGDGNPSYEALKKAYAALKAYPVNGKRIVLYITDGGASCTSVASPQRSAYEDGNGCLDWENPANMVTLIQDAHDDKTPVNTFVVGVPGADTYDPSGQSAPPYHVRNALSAYAYAGSPETVDANCTGKTYSQGGGDPSVSCHFDMTRNNFSKDALGNAIQQIRGRILGCTYELPTPEGGGTVDRNQVNVQVESGGKVSSLFRRKDASNACADGCWDYTSDGKVELLGSACEQVKDPESKVEIVVGCETLLR